MNKDYLIQEKPLKALFILALPMIIGNLFQQLYTMMDSIIVGRMIGEDALAAIGASYSLTTVFVSIAIGGGIGASVLTSRYFGGKRYADMKRAIHLALITFLALSFILGLVGVIGSRQILIWLRTPASILGIAEEYLNIYFYGLPFLFLYNVVSAMFNALGRSRIPLYLLVCSSLINIGLDVLMVGPLGMGVAGAAWATLIAQGFAAITSFFLFLKEMSNFKVVAAKGNAMIELKKMASIALPSILQQSTVSIGMMLVQSVVNGFGTQMLAGFSAAMRVESLCLVPMVSIGNAISPFTAQNLGANKSKRVEKGYRAGIALVAIFAVLIGLLLELKYNHIISLFIGKEGTILTHQTGVNYLRFMGWFYALLGFKMVTDGVLRGAGDMMMFTIANLCNLSVRVILAVTLAPTFGIEVVWYAVPLGWLVNNILSISQYRTGRWRGLGKAEENKIVVVNQLRED